MPSRRSTSTPCVRLGLKAKWFRSRSVPPPSSVRKFSGYKRNGKPCKHNLPQCRLPLE